MKSTPVQENSRWHLRQIMRAVGGNNAVASMLNGVSTSYITIVAGPAPTPKIEPATGPVFFCSVLLAFRLAFI